MKNSSHVVGVVIPMYNAENTISATLRSVTGQSYGLLDIIVVDDGSDDGSAEIVQRWAEVDRRIRLLRQRNLGVAIARNNGAAATPAQYLAFVDADDLWAPEKIAEQMRLLTQDDDRVGVAYSWYANIDLAGRVTALKEPRDEGQVLSRLANHFFVGHGSSLLIHRTVFDAVGGFDPSLQAKGAQGCEDMMFCISAAQRFDFRVVPRYLVGYRETDVNMSSNFRRMITSAELVLDRLVANHPELAAEARANLDATLLWFIRRGLLTGRLIAAAELYMRLFKRDASFALRSVPELGLAVLRTRFAAALRQRVARGERLDRRLRYEDVIW